MSHGRNKYQSRENRARVNKLFRSEWDPIGMGHIPDLPDDEYVRYADKAYVMLRDDRASADAIAEYLYAVATRHMGLSDSERLIHERCARVAATLVELRPEFETH